MRHHLKLALTLQGIERCPGSVTGQEFQTIATHHYLLPLHC